MMKESPHKPFFSVIIPTYNRAYVLTRAIGSVLNQSFKDFELIIVDDGSKDSTSEVLETYKEHSQIKIIKIENRGVSYARNVGIKKALGEWCAFLDSDDEWLFHKLETQFNFIKENPHIPLVHGEEIWIRNGKRVNQKKVHQKFGGNIFKKCLPLCLISPSAVAIKKEILHEMEMFDEKYPVCEDYDLWLKITSLYEVGFISDPIINKYGGHEDQLSRKFFAMDYWRLKALDRILKIRPLLSKIDQKSVKEEIQKKGNILLSGYRKHNNMDQFAEVERLVINNLCPQ